MDVLGMLYEYINLFHWQQTRVQGSACPPTFEWLSINMEVCFYSYNQTGISACKT